MDLLPFVTDVGVALGLLIGVEREMRHREAGVRTNTLVCLGAALFVSISRMLVPGGDSGRIAAQVVSGVGFLAGGVIIRDGFSVRGLNTAGTLWCTAAIGTLAGAGFRIPAALGALAVLTLHLALRPFSAHFDDLVTSLSRPETGYRFRITCTADAEAALRSALLEAITAAPGMQLRSLQGAAGERHDERVVCAEAHARAADDAAVERLCASLMQRDGILGGGWERLISR
jgi:putative Mg2+ transporter-C (MgtC) family protein